MNYEQLTQTLAESFCVIADEVQSLVDRKTILEHKLRFAHEQYQYLADRFAPAVPEISETLAKLQLPPELRQPSTFSSSKLVPLPRRGQSDTWHHIALSIREGRKAAQQLADLAEMSKTSGSSKEDSSPFAVTDTLTSLSTVLEQDFTVQGRKGLLGCPFSKTLKKAGSHHTADEEHALPSIVGDRDQRAPADEFDSQHEPNDPICAAMHDENIAEVAQPTSPAKCPIRYLDQHSPEEIAHYVETHKHEIPRSHEVCVRRYQQNEEQIRKLDAKYGNLASMIKDLSQLHQPMLPTNGQREVRDDVDRASNERVEDWANGVASDVDHPEEQAGSRSNAGGDGSRHMDVDDEASRESHFDRPLKEVRVGESPSRPWGISVPVYPASPSDPQPRPVSPPPAPVRMPSPKQLPQPSQEASRAASARKCPFDHTKLGLASSPFPGIGSGPVKERPAPSESGPAFASEREPFTPAKNGFETPGQHRAQRPQPTFVNTPIPMPAREQQLQSPAVVPQVVFNISGPTFIGYSMEQAMQFMQMVQTQRNP